MFLAMCEVADAIEEVNPISIYSGPTFQASTTNITPHPNLLTLQVRDEYKGAKLSGISLSRLISFIIPTKL